MTLTAVAWGDNPAIRGQGYNGDKSAPALFEQPGAWPDLARRSDMPERTCRVEGCERQAYVPGAGRGWCPMHYHRWQRHGDPGSAAPQLVPDRTCDVEGCEKPHEGHGYCAKHYARWRKHGDPLVGGWPPGRGESVAAIHEWMWRTFPKVGRCEYCARRGKTEYASIGHTYTRHRDDWFELCSRCHVWFDIGRWRNNGEHFRSRTHCPQGHEYTPENTYCRPGRTERSCKICRRIEKREYMRRRHGYKAAA